MSTVYREMRNYQVYQQALFLGILNQSSSMIIQKPIKKAIVTQQLVTVNSLQFSRDDQIAISDLIERRCKEMMKLDLSNGLREKTAIRRYETNKVTEVLHLLSDILNEFGFTFRTSKTTGKNKSAIAETVNVMYFKGRKAYSKQQITQIGMKINQYLYEKCAEGDGNTIIERNDPMIHSLLQGNQSIVVVSS
ncbi:hypothetical protein ENUP19_0241G0007 [Entamoeba nuttalli]|uniref:TATA-binding protein-associated phosphoprotein n=1 Tax=Entamoeba nuttalli TaxID=412467 RepID=A0ABQ0DQP1_9EUKA